MTGLLLGVAMLVSTAGVSPAPELPHPSFTPAAFTLQLPDEPTMAQWARASAPRVRTAPPPRENLTGRIIAAAAGATLGFFAGGIIGGKITDRSDENPNDDTSVLKGAFIGAPIGAAVGAIIGWRLTKN